MKSNLDFEAKHLPADPRFPIVTLGHLVFPPSTAVTMIYIMIYRLMKVQTQLRKQYVELFCFEKYDQFHQAKSTSAKTTNLA